LLDKLKTEFDTNFKSSKKTMQDIVDSYSQLKTPTTEANKKVLDDLNKNITSMAENNLKLWSELISNTNKPSSNNDDETSTNKPSFHSNGKATMPKTI
jgi:ribosomal protein S17E